MPLWEGRFEEGTNPEMWVLNASIGFDRRMAEQDVRGSIAWVDALKAAGVIGEGEVNQIKSGLNRIQKEFEAGEFVYKSGDEDIHTAVERRLGELIGPVAGKLHTGRSRNDQVATDFRLWLLDHLPDLDAALTDLQEALLARAEVDMGILMPGYTHLQRAQPLLLSHWWLSHFWPLQRDRQRLADLHTRISVLPLGCGALAGVPFEVDRLGLAERLGFDTASPNSIDAVSDRDFAVEFLFAAALIGSHLSRLAEAVVLFSSAEFGFFELDDAHTTGSSLMPQKKNPDAFELTRGKAGILLGNLTGLMAVLKALPSAYDKDLQEDKVPVFGSLDTLITLLPVIANAVRGLTVHAQRMEAAIDSMMMATDLADYLVEKGVPFREAHHITGQIVRFALEEKMDLLEIPLESFKTIHEGFNEDVYQILDPRHSVLRRRSLGGTAPDAVQEQLEMAQSLLKKRGDSL